MFVTENVLCSTSKASLDPFVTIHKVSDGRGKVIGLVNVRTCFANLWGMLSSKASLSCDCSPEIGHSYSRRSIKEELSGRTQLKTL